MSFIQGKWHSKDGFIDFEPFLSLEDLDSFEWTENPQRLGQCRGSLKGKYIIIDEDRGYIFSGK